MKKNLLTRAVVLACVLVGGNAFAQTGAPQNTVKLTAVLMGLPAGTSWMTVSLGAFCIKPVTQVWNGGQVPQALPPYAGAFKTELEQAGFKVVTPGEDNLFDPEAGSADYEAAAVITDASIHACLGGLGHKLGDTSGDSMMKIDWQIYSPIKKLVVARFTTDFSVKQDKSEGGVERLIMASFVGNVRALAANADFRAALSNATPLVNGVLLPGQQEKIALSGSLKAGKHSIADAVGSIVTLLTSSGSGSGILVSGDGYMLTDAHVVGADKQIRVRWSDGIQTAAQVVRVAKDRDIALIKTDARDREPLAIKRGAVSPGQRVYAIGSPKGQDFEGTVSSGVISASRIFNGLRYIQSDVAVSPGSSGGALLDENGAVLGLTDLGVDNEGRAGLNLFIPIGDALDFLNLEQK